MSRYLRWPAALAGLAALVLLIPPAPAQPEPPVRLAVLVFFDQLRGDYLARWDTLFGDGGFHRLDQEGAWFTHCHYPYALTVTGAGHASVATGCPPSVHGIVDNDWYDRTEGAAVNCVATDRYARVPPARARAEASPAPEGDPGGTKKKKKPKAAAPVRLLQPTAADAFKAATAGRGKVVALSFKDRAAVLPGGRQPDACYWLDEDTGEFITSTYYRDSPHAWVTAFNRGRPADRWFGTFWTRLRPDLDYARYSGPDDGAGEALGVAQGRCFPHPLDGGLPFLSPTYYAALYNSPFGNELLLDLAREAIAAEALGTRDVPDLLCLSFSCNDPVGHCWGPDSQEVLDCTLRADHVVRQLLEALDRQVGRGRYALVLTADHGACPLPEVSRANGLEAARVPATLLSKGAEAYLTGRYGAGEGKFRYLEATQGPWAYLNRRGIAQRGLDPEAVEADLAEWLRGQPGIAAVYTRAQLLAGVDAEDPIGRAVRKSFHPDRSGDLMVVVKPHHLFLTALTGTTHGTPHPYDTHVPLLVYAPGVAGGPRTEPVTPLAVPAILGRTLGITPPASAAYPVPGTLFASPK